MTEPGADCDLAMSPQQQRFSRQGGLAAYKDLLVADRCWLTFSCFEVFNLLFSGMPSIAGIAARSVFLPFFCKRFGKKTVIGRGVTIRQPSRIAFGRGVIVDDYAMIDVRSPADGRTTEVGIDIGDHVLIGRASLVTTKGGLIKLGDACNISSSCRIATRSRIEIGESTLIAAYCYIGCGNHSIDDLSKPIIEQQMDVRGGVKIGKHVWIGARATILDGVTIGDNAVVGAHSLVREDVPANAVVAGTPARVIRYRGEQGGARSES